MQRTPVSSSNIASIGYDEASETLEIEFHNGGVYQYFNVSAFIFEGIMTADSCGGYFHANIRTAFPWQKV